MAVVTAYDFRDTRPNDEASDILYCSVDLAAWHVFAWSASADLMALMEPQGAEPQTTGQLWPRGDW